MKLLSFIFTSFIFAGGTFQNEPTTSLQAKTGNQNISTKIQVAILLDVSNSMDGLIGQAKAQLWNMVNTVGKAKCEGATPQIEIALYEYGRSTNNLKEGYIKQISPFTTDLDLLSETLFNLSTNGGDEFCSQVIYTSLLDLKWDNTPGYYKVIFIAGNEDFNQGSIAWTTACTEAKKKGVIVNTIYCGDIQQGIREHWNLGTECGEGSYTNINQNATIEDIETPYDSALFVMNNNLNNTYIAYGSAGMAKAAKQEEMDRANRSMSKEVMAKRVSVKGKSSLYKNDSWDLVDASIKDSAIIENVDLKSLPPALANKSRTEVRKIVQEKSTERGVIQKDIVKLVTQREAFIATERKKNSIQTEATLETEIERILKTQGKRFNLKFE